MLDQGWSYDSCIKNKMSWITTNALKTQEWWDALEPCTWGLCWDRQLRLITNFLSSTSPYMDRNAYFIHIRAFLFVFCYGPDVDEAVLKLVTLLPQLLCIVSLHLAQCSLYCLLSYFLVFTPLMLYSYRQFVDSLWMGLISLSSFWDRASL